MTANKDLKALIRARKQKTGESYSVARRHILEKGGRLCPACREPLQTRVVQELTALDDNATEGQMADHLAAIESGEWGDWAVESVEVFCARCEPPIRHAIREVLRVDRGKKRR